MLKHKKEVTTENKVNDVDWNNEHFIYLLEHEKREMNLQTLTGLDGFTVESRYMSLSEEATEPEMFLVIAKATVTSNSSSGAWELSSLLQVDDVNVDESLMAGTGPDQAMTVNNLHILTVNPGDYKNISFKVIPTVDATLYPASAMLVILKIGNIFMAPPQS